MFTRGYEPDSCDIQKAEVLADSLFATHPTYV